MATQHHQEAGDPISETAVQSAVLQQAQAAAAGQTEFADSTTQEVLWQDTDLVTSEASEEDVPPPAYGDSYGEVRNEKDGLGTSANVTDDGRVNIRINQLNRRLSQVFVPALRQQVRAAQESRPPPYIPPSLGGEKGAPPPPLLNVVIQVVGSRGDVQPFVALGKVLKDSYGHRIRLATHPNFKSFVEENGLEFFSIGGDPSRLMAFMVKNPGLMPGFRSLVGGDVSDRRRDIGHYIQGCWRSCYMTGDGMSVPTADDDLSEHSTKRTDSEQAAKPFVADCIIANPPSFAHVHCAERLGIPLHIMFTMPYSATQAFPHPLANIQSSNADAQLTNYISYAMIEHLTWQGLGDIINRFRKKCLGLDPVSLLWAPGMLQHLKVPHTYCWSPALISKPVDWGPHISIAGFYFLSTPDYTPKADLQAFLDAGPRPVYIGFGSIVLDNPDAMTKLIFEAAKQTGQRVLLSKGWGGIGADDIPENIFMLGNVPHDWLFKHVSCVVHHGGAGTTAAGIAAGRPTVVVPFFGDQPFWGAMVARAGAGPDPIPHRQLTAEKLANAINFCLKPESLDRAKELASRIATEQGSDTGAQSVHQYLEVDRLRCVLTPSRNAVWRIKGTKIRLSPFAACTLANANLLDFHDLRLYRPQEYVIDEGPTDPISGAFTSFVGAVNGMATGLIGVPTETFRAVREPFKHNRQQSEASLQSVSRKSISSKSPTQSQTSLSTQDSLARTKSTDRPSGPSSQRSNSLEHPDMLRPTGPHTSRGLGRTIRTLVQAPGEIAVGLTKGSHNVPKLWGDDTVRPQEKVSDLKSGMKAMGREFGLGWYDGLTGLVTQPWQGAQKEGVAGFAKGFGKGIGGFAFKPMAGLLGILGHTMKGVHKEIQKAFGSNVQGYIIASRTAQGYEEWLQSSSAEKQQVVTRWRLIQKHLKRKPDPEMLRDLLGDQMPHSVDNNNTGGSRGRTASAPSTNSTDDAPQDLERSESAMTTPPIPLRSDARVYTESSKAIGMDEEHQSSLQHRTRRDAAEVADPIQAARQTTSQLQHHPHELSAGQDGREYFSPSMVINEGEVRHSGSRASEFEAAPDPVLAQSPITQSQSASDREWDSDLEALDDEEDEAFDRARRASIAERAAVGAQQPSALQRRPLQHTRHLAGTTREEFEVQQRHQQGEKSTQEKTEEEIVMEYVKKQSLLERFHADKGKARAAATADQENEELQRALKLSMQEHRHVAESWLGESSGP